MHGRGTIGRTFTFVLLGALIGGAMLSPVWGAAAPATKKFVKKQINKAKTQIQDTSDARYGQLIYRRSASAAVEAGTDETLVATCPAGTNAIGGGHADATIGFGPDVTTHVSAPTNGDNYKTGFTGWMVVISNDSGATYFARAYVICTKTFAPIDADYAAGVDLFV